MAIPTKFLLPLLTSVFYAVLKLFIFLWEIIVKQTCNRIE